MRNGWLSLDLHPSTARLVGEQLRYVAEYQGHHVQWYRRIALHRERLPPHPTEQAEAVFDPGQMLPDT